MITVSTSKTYHHGDLRAALIAAGLAALERCEVKDFSLRQLARATGVSATAVYRHFPDKQALLAALAGEGVVMLGEAQRRAAESTAEGDRFAATGRAYVRFALANPGLFRLVFSHGEGLVGALSPTSEAGRMLHDNAVTLAGSEAGAPRVEAQAWAIAHGLAMLMLDGWLPKSEALIDAAIASSAMFARQAGSSSEASP